MVVPTTSFSVHKTSVVPATSFSVHKTSAVAMFHGAVAQYLHETVIQW
ncbi:hypothetical protein [Lysinibacillus piscis]|nr:hypothetical protein [Lysinibacillus sp. KH24]